jgi:hypothetical protein
MFSVHIGAPGVLSESISNDYLMIERQSPHGVYCVGRDEYDSHVHPFISYRGKDLLEMEQLRSNSSRFLVQASAVGHLLLSAPICSSPGGPSLSLMGASVG